MPDVFGLRAFDQSEPVIWVLPGDLSYMIQMLVPDVAATSVAFHDILIEDLKSTLEFRTKLMSSRDLISLRRRWPSSLLADMQRRQAAMETIAVPVRRNLIVSGVVVEPGLARTVNHIFRSRYPVTLRITTWNWGSSGGTRSAGVQSGRGPPRIVWITCAVDMA